MIDWLIGWLFGRSVSRSIDWLIGIAYPDILLIAGCQQLQVKFAVCLGQATRTAKRGICFYGLITKVPLSDKRGKQLTNIASTVLLRTGAENSFTNSKRGHLLYDFFPEKNSKDHSMPYNFLKMFYFENSKNHFMTNQY